MTIFTQTMRSASTKMQALELSNQSISKLIAQVLLAVSLLIGMVGFSLTTHGQCSFFTQYGSAAAPAAGQTVNFQSCTYAGEHNIMTGAAESKIYTVLSTNGNDYVTVRQGFIGGTVIGSGDVPFTFTSTAAGMYFFHISADSSCSVENTCRNTSVSRAAEGCTSIDACNYDPLAITDNGSCTYPGCVENGACNFDPNAACDDGSCIFFVDCAGTCGGTFILDDCENCFDPNLGNPLCNPGCDDPLADNFDPTVNYNNGSCLFFGCIDPTACNFDADANSDDGSCFYPDGCNDPIACNFDPNATCNNGTCTYPGCNDEAACNYDPNAACDDGSCLFADCAGICGGNSIVDDCGNCHDLNDLFEQVVEFSYSGNIQLWAVPEGVTQLTIEAQGAQGGGSEGGLGALIQSTVSVTPGQTLKILVGQRGICCNYNNGGGGGGGSFVTLSDNTPLVIAGGGGGTAEDYTAGQPGLTTTSGGSACTISGGSNGNGGSYVSNAGTDDPFGDDGPFDFGGGCGDGGGGGAGLLTNGGGNAGGGVAFVNGGNGANGATPGMCITPNFGGFGGGGAGGNGGGGGGGYSGGAGGSNLFGGCGYTGGMGGGSFNSGILLLAQGGVRSDNGTIVISFVAVPECNTGCTDPLADNFDPQANFDDGSCSTAGCTDPLAANFNPNANQDNGTCLFLGCTYPAASNYDANANDDDGSCVFDDGSADLGCTDQTACNYNAMATIDDASCEFDSCTGCTDPTACNFNASASIEDNSCDYGCIGCTYSAANNYNANATIDDGSCTFGVSEISCGFGTFWDPITETCVAFTDCPADLNGDGIVNSSDLLAFLGAFGSLCN